MYDVHLLQVFDTPHQLSQNDSRFILPQCTSLLQQRSKVETVRVLLYHVDLLTRLDCLEVANAVVALHHAMNLDLLKDQLEVVFREALRIKDLARVDRLLWVDG